MANYFNLFWQQLFAPGTRPQSEVERISILQQAAASRRAEYAEEMARTALAGDASPSGPLAASRKRMQAAETAHMVALQKWENKQSGQRSY